MMQEFIYTDIGSSHSWILMPSVASVKTLAGGSSSRLHRRSPWQQQSTTYSTQWRTQHVKWRVNVPIWCLAIDWIADTFPGQLNMRRLDWLSCMSTLAVVMADVWNDVLLLNTDIYTTQETKLSPIGRAQHYTKVLLIEYDSRNNCSLWPR